MPLDIAVFCRNVESMIGRCLANLKDQSQVMGRDFLPVRAIVLENGSTDRSAEAAREARRELASSSKFEVRVLSLPASGKTAAWNVFLTIAESPIVGFIDADVALAAGALARLTSIIGSHPDLDIVGALPALPPRFKPRGFWQSLFAVPYRDLTPWPSLSGNAYLARRDRLSPMPDEVVNEDLYLAIRHAGAIRLCEGARVYVTPPAGLADFIRQRARIRRGDVRELARNRAPVSRHRRRGLRDLAAFYRAAGLLGLAAFLSASGLAFLAARMPFIGGAIEAAWKGDAAGRLSVLPGAQLGVVNAGNARRAR